MAAAKLTIANGTAEAYRGVSVRCSKGTGGTVTSSLPKAVEAGLGFHDHFCVSTPSITNGEQPTMLVRLVFSGAIGFQLALSPRLELRRV